MSKVIVFGTFDILHAGHRHMLEEAHTFGNQLVVVVARDATVHKIKGRLPQFDEITRSQNLRDLNIADRVILGDTQDYHKVLRDEKPDVVALGYDQKAFTEDIEKNLQYPVRIVRLQAFHPEKYKSSFFRKD